MCTVHVVSQITRGGSFDLTVSVTPNVAFTQLSDKLRKPGSNKMQIDQKTSKTSHRNF